MEIELRTMPIRMYQADRKPSNYNFLHIRFLYHNFFCCRLFSYVNDSIFNRPTYQVFMNLRNEFNPDIKVAEVNSTQKQQNIDNFMETIMATDVFNSMWQFLQSFGKDIEKFVTHRLQWIKMSCNYLQIRCILAISSNVFSAARNDL